MDWQRLDRTKTAEIIARVATARDAGLFSLPTSEAACQPLPFYRGLLLYRLTNYATLPSFSLDFLGDGISFYPLDGSSDTILQANARGALALNEQNVIDYVDFFLKNVATEDGDIYLIRNTEDLPFLDSLSIDQQLHLKRRHNAIDLAYDPENDAYMVQADLYYAGTLLKSLITVHADGRIEFSGQSMLMGDGSSDRSQPMH